MYVNRADWGEPHEDLVDTTRPLLITSVGHYRLHSAPTQYTYREKGRGDYQLVYVAGGCGYFRFDGIEREVKKGQMVLFRPGVTQDYYFHSANKGEYFWCHFTGGQVARLLEECGISPRRRVFATPPSSDFQWLFLQMIRELQLRQTSYETILEMNLRHILLLLAREGAEEATADNAMLGEIENAIRHFNMHYNWDIVVKDYAESHLMSPYWFSQSFKKVTGTSPTQYIISVRMANAMNLLDNSDLTIAQVAAAVGYENTQYFHRLFRKHTGMTPKEYRRHRQG